MNKLLNGLGLILTIVNVDSLFSAEPLKCLGDVEVSPGTHRRILSNVDDTVMSKMRAFITGDCPGYLNKVMQIRRHSLIKKILNQQVALKNTMSTSAIDFQLVAQFGELVMEQYKLESGVGALQIFPSKGGGEISDSARFPMPISSGSQNECITP